MLTAQRLRELLTYDPKTGVWTWNIAAGRRVKPGMEAGSINGSGKRTIQVDGSSFLSSRLAWLYMTGEWPKSLIDHKNRKRSDDRWENLRQASYSQNSINRCGRRDNPANRRLPRGVHPHRGAYFSIITINKKRKYLGTFKTPGEAYSAYLEASGKEEKLHGEFLP